MGGGRPCIYEKKERTRKEDEDEGKERTRDEERTRRGRGKDEGRTREVRGKEGNKHTCYISTRIYMGFYMQVLHYIQPRNTHSYNTQHTRAYVTHNAGG